MQLARGEHAVENQSVRAERRRRYGPPHRSSRATRRVLRDSGGGARRTAASIRAPLRPALVAVARREDAEHSRMSPNQRQVPIARPEGSARRCAFMPSEAYPRTRMNYPSILCRACVNDRQSAKRRGRGGTACTRHRRSPPNKGKELRAKRRRPKTTRRLDLREVSGAARRIRVTTLVLLLSRRRRSPAGARWRHAAAARSSPDKQEVEGVRIPYLTAAQRRPWSAAGYTPASRHVETDHSAARRALPVIDPSAGIGDSAIRRTASR